MPILQEQTDIPRESLPYEALLGFVSADVATGAAVGDPVKFDAIQGDQKLITVTQESTETKINLKKGHRYRCWADVVYADTNSTATALDREYAWFDSQDAEQGIRGLESFYESKFDYDSPTVAIIDTKDQDVEISVKVAAATDTAVSHYLRGSKCLIEVITDVSGPFN